MSSVKKLDPFTEYVLEGKAHMKLNTVSNHLKSEPLWKGSTLQGALEYKYLTTEMLEQKSPL